MQILGIYIYPDSKGISKVLKPGWFPFGNYPAPIDDKLLSLPKIHGMIQNVYSSKRGPKIYIKAIVGQNGAGKSTLLEIIFALLNNLVIKILGNQKAKNHSRQLNLAKGVYADLYFIIDKVQYKVCGKDTNVTLFIGEDKDTVFKHVPIFENNSNENLESLFYTIITNYSLYAYNTSEYGGNNNDKRFSKNINGEWMDGLFHKNDGYYTPIVITPFRTNGTINIEKESYLAEQRINLLALLAAAKEKSFIDCYNPSKLFIKFRSGFIEEKTKALRLIAEEKDCPVDYMILLKHFKEGWLQTIKSWYPNEIIPTKTNQFKVSIFYLAYKSIKICLNYLDYRNALGLDDELKKFFKKEEEKIFIELLDKKIDHVISKILKDMEELDDEHNHLVLKIEQVIDYLKYYFKHKSFQWKNRAEIDVSIFLNKNKKINRYCDIFRLLPPSFYDTQLEFTKNGNQIESSWNSFTQSSMRLSQMSSGERHLLTCLSYILYHIKNIESIKADKERVKYKRICLVFDEIELYFHPDFQRRFVKMLLEALSWCNISNHSIKSIQILLVTHSPFILTDIFTHNTLYLRDGKADKVTEETFGANYYDLLNNSFFFDQSAIGEISTGFIKKLVDNNKRRQVSNLLEYVGDQMIKGYIKNHLSK